MAVLHLHHAPIYGTKKKLQMRENSK